MRTGGLGPGGKEGDYPFEERGRSTSDEKEGRVE